MPIITCDCTGNGTCCSVCKLNVVGYVTGWLGVIWRIVLVAFLSTTLSNITEYDPSLYSILLATCLCYVLTSLVVNSVFIYGVYKKKRHFMLPYITLAAFELIIGVIILSGIIMVLFAVSAVLFAVYTICFAVLIIGINFTLWLYTILLYNDFEYDAKLTRGEFDNIALTRMHSINSHT
ncbi:uncharacterized protein LOC109546572 [Dendroctonus ponderosae]|uniref:uncharacterized protein LOC109546572 n=1 Tax=Dendroctonus ponderosae TaxID=77166 RepID=UPI002035D8AC|nr:uncharacterized protein LOC109546572 [Dendroctonus ponderosae]